MRSITHTAAVIAAAGSLAFTLSGCAGGNSTTSSEPDQATTSGAPSTTPATPEPSTGAPLASFNDGTLTVGKDIQPGTYHTAGAARDGVDCYWATAKDPTGNPGAIIHNHASRNPQTVTITPDVAAFHSEGCQTWSLVPAGK